MKNLGDGFTFLALAYNHEKYIIEHLESIKYLVEKYGSGINCKIIINDYEFTVIKSSPKKILLLEATKC